MASRRARSLALFGDVEDTHENEHDRAVAIGRGYVRAKLGTGYDMPEADRELQRLALAEVAKLEWEHVLEEVRKAYVRLYGRAAAPTWPFTWADRQAVAIAMAGGPGRAVVSEDAGGAEVDHDAAERAAIEAA